MNLWPDLFKDPLRVMSPVEILQNQVDKFNDSVVWNYTFVTQSRCDLLACVSHDLAMTVSGNGKLIRILWLGADDYPCLVAGVAAPRGWLCKTEAELISKMALLMNHQKTRFALEELLK